ncbi:hypothetical protein [Micromonospora sp. NPDC049679]|uniref:hypothetical protein n=1 Tax=Micromonospora sp. NPDC049679 TaxID=3155920 RepID=UPI0033F8D112
MSYTLKSKPDQMEPEQALGITDDRYKNRLGHSVSDLRRRTKIGERWRRLSMLVLMSSAFERFLLGIATAAVNSDPTRTPGFPKRLDGLLLKKYNLNVEQVPLEGLTRGEWSSRIAEYRRLFGDAPSTLLQAESELDRLRKARNAVAHQFAVEARKLSEHTMLVLGARRAAATLPQSLAVSHESVLRWLRCIGEVSDAVDHHLTRDYIGGYESGLIYLEWLQSPSKFEKSVGVTLQGHNKTDTLRFNNMFSELLGNSVGKVYTRSLQAYVDKL